ncbi:MAG: GntR family transcriptional regulator [Actinobacteria bacterium]|nr:GntR family transcriptional regulator [Actinomycetota bacterium]
MTQVTPPASSPSGPAASTSSVHAVLRERIAAGQLAAGDWLREAHLAAELGTSRTPVREALRTLAAEGLVELVHHRGARVVQWSAADLDETYRLRALLEGEAAGLAAQRASREDVAAMAEAQARYERSIADGAPMVERAGCNDAFHAAVLAASGSTRLPVLLAVITSAPLRARAIGSYTPDDLQRSVLQHRDVLTAVREGDEGLAVAAMRSHILAARYVAMTGVG